MNAKDIPSVVEIERIKQKIIRTSITAWEHHITEASLDRWLTNFTGDVLGDKHAEQVLASWLLMNFTYYSTSEVKELCRVIYRRYIHEKLSQDKYRKLKISTPDKIREILKRTIFVPLGNPSESGALILYHFRTANSLSKDIFELPAGWEHRLHDGTADDIVLIDDVTLSGEQAAKYIKALNLGTIGVSLLTFFATPQAIENLSKKAPSCGVLFAQLLDERTKLFSDSSFVFSNNDTKSLKDYAHTLCYEYGKKIVENELPPSEAYMKRFPLGFADGQQMFGFFYNTPDNTLPIFWCDTPNWHSAFQRFSKVYGVKGVEIADEKYW